jgi:hypothetical protein
LGIILLFVDLLTGGPDFFDGVGISTMRPPGFSLTIVPCIHIGKQEPFLYRQVFRPDDRVNSPVFRVLSKHNYNKLAYFLSVRFYVTSVKESLLKITLEG